MDNMKIVFMGTPKFAAHILEGLLQNNYNIVGVVTQPDKEVGRKKILTFSDVKEVALKYNLPVFQPIKIRNDFENILSLNPDLIITSAYGQIIPKEILDFPKFKCINTHGSLLPKYRGGAPIQRSIINGEEETGMTIMYMNEKMDEGDIISQKAIKIELEDTNATIFDKLSGLALNMLLELLPNVESIKAFPQDHLKATYSPNLKKEDEYINFNLNTLTVYNHIRGLLDNPGAYSILENKKYKFHKVNYRITNKDCSCQAIGLVDNKFAIGTSDGEILVELIQPEGKNIMPAKDFFNGVGKSLIGKRFEVTNGSK